MRSRTSIRGVARIVLLAAAVATPASAGDAEIDGLGWLAGCWRSVDGDRTSEECWTDAGGGMLLGVHRDVGPRGAAFEFLRIGRDGDSVAYFASPGGRPATAFKLVSSGDRRAVFENPEHDFPQRLIYWMEGDDTLRARVEADEEGKTKGLDFAWDRVASGWAR